MNKDYRYKNENENRTYAVPINNLKLIWQTIPNGLFQQSHIRTPFQQNFFYNQYETVALAENYKIKSQNLYHQGMFNEALELLIKSLNIYIWSHGTGIDDRDLYNENPTRERLFVKNQEIEEIAVSFDDTSKDFIDNIELKKALETNINIDILGFDACLMGMFEIAYQLRENINIMVASQYIEPPSGWNYEDILENIKLEDKSTTMADKIVKYYIDKYEQSMSEVTQSALNTKNIETIAKLIDKFILSNETSGWNMQDANGVSIYFPTRKSPFKETFELYEKLDFSINYPNWVELIRWYYKNI